MRISTNWQNFDVEMDDATFVVSPLTGVDNLMALRIVGEITARSRSEFMALSAEAQVGLVDFLKRRIVGWRNVSDENGMPLQYDQRLLDGIPAHKLFQLFTRIYAAAHVTDEERKNSATA